MQIQGSGFRVRDVDLGIRCRVGVAEGCTHLVAIVDVVFADGARVDKARSVACAHDRTDVRNVVI